MVEVHTASDAASLVSWFGTEASAAGMGSISDTMSIHDAPD